MPRKSKAVPKYCLHKASGRAVVRIDGRDYYLGLYGTPESPQKHIVSDIASTATAQIERTSTSSSG